jgi:hypothetical protein
LHVGQEVKVVFHAGEDVAAEAGVAVEESFHREFVGFQCSGSSHG